MQYSQVLLYKRFVSSLQHAIGEVPAARLLWSVTTKSELKRCESRLGQQQLSCRSRQHRLGGQEGAELTTGQQGTLNYVRNVWG